ncbi:MAG: ATP phosphoribosyltransferase [Sphingomonadales bacterium]
MEKTRLRIAIQKKGRLAEDTFALLKDAGLTIQKNKGGLFYRIKNLPIDLLLVRDDDIPGFVFDGVADLGIVGGNVYEEYALTHTGSGAECIQELGFSRCNLCLALPETEAYFKLEDFNGKTIATSFPNILNAYFDKVGVKINTVEMHGSVEVAPKLGIADAICDIVSSGATLEENSLVNVETIFRCQALLLKTTQALIPEKEATIKTLLSRFEGVRQSKETKYIMMNAPRSALPRLTTLLPGAGAPTVMPLEGQTDAVAIHAVCRESVFWETMEGLRAAGASSILVLPIEKMLT